jgi:hypothetical protein
MPRVPHFRSPHELAWASVLIASPFPPPDFYVWYYSYEHALGEH